MAGTLEMFFLVGKEKKSVMGWGKSEEVGKSVSF